MMDVALGLRAAMHELGNENGASVVHGVDYQPPAVPVCFRSKPRLVEVTLAVGRIGIDAFADDHAEATLGERGVVVAHQFIGSTLGFGADAGHRRNGRAIAQLQVF